MPETYHHRGFSFLRTKGETVTLEESDLSVMVDAAALPAPTFDMIPSGAFSGDGGSFPNASGVTGHVVWKSDWLGQGGSGQSDWLGCGAVAPTLWTGKTTMDLSDDIVNIAPLFGSKTLLGEASEITAVSSYRFSSVSGDAATGIVTAHLRGRSSEVVTLMVATKNGASFACSTKAMIIGADGTAIATL